MAMSDLPAPAQAAEPLAEGFAQHIERWATARGGDAASVRLARRAALELSRAVAKAVGA